MDESYNWPVRADGYMLIEYHSEDGKWAGYAESGTNGGKEAVPIRVMKPGDVVLSSSEVQRLKNTLMVARDYLEGESFTKQADQVQVWIELLEGKMEAK